MHQDQEEQKFLVARQSKANSMLRSRGNSKGVSCSPQSVPANSSAQGASRRNRTQKTALPGVTTRKCSECTASWTKHARAARRYVRCTPDDCRSGGSRRHVSDVPIADIWRTSPNHRSRALAIITAHALIVVTAKNQSPDLSGDASRPPRQGSPIPASARPRRLAGDALSIHSRRRNREFPECCRVQLNRADRLGVYVGAEIDFSPGLQL